MSVNVETEIELLKREVSDMKGIHVRLDAAIEKIADVSSSLHTIMAVHEEKLARQEDALNEQENQLRDNIQDLHSRITTNTKEIMGAAAQQHLEQNKEIQKIRDELSTRVGVLEKWRWIIIGGSIIAGFIIQKYMIIGG